MSQQRQITIECPHCHQPMACTCWDSVNSEHDPDAAAELMTGRLFTTECPHCHGLVSPNYSTLWHDMARGVMIQYSASDDDKTLARHREMMDKTTDALRKRGVIINMQMRIVTERADLVEKAQMFRADLDDRVVEMMKLIIYGTLEHQKDERPADIKFYIVDGKKAFAALDEQGACTGTLPFIDDMYDTFAARMAFDDTPTYFVNIGWAADYLEAHPTLFDD